MKFPSWVVAEIAPQEQQNGASLGTLKVTVRIRRWHPGWWLTVARAYWQAWRRAGNAGDAPRRRGKVIPHG